jgi:cbb3-type cytochrome oxidase cytochrome c subunit
MKSLQPLFLGIFGIFAFSWLGMTVVPNFQIGNLNPQSDEEGTDIYPLPPSGMVTHGAKVYAANGCFYCHSQQVRPEYGGADIERKWGDRRSAPRDYIFEPVVFLGKMRNGPDLANVGHRPALQESGAAAPTGGATASPGPAPAGGASPAAQASPGASQSPAPSASPASSATPAPSANASPSPSAGTAASPAASAPAAPASAAVSAAASPAAGNPPATNAAASAPVLVENAAAMTSGGEPAPYSAAWHHRHLYDPRSVVADSNMPSYRYLYTRHRIGGIVSPDAINFAGASGTQAEAGWEIVPSYDAKCLVAYLMSRNQSHPLKEAKSALVAPPAAASPSPAKEAQK